ncbi:MAG: hypothetical protein RR636_08065 [Clostridium sp.]|uniref:hypothetical protein n=1 Tax=Clostridium sp. TaxID=1506 RepID=UPI00305D1E8D
MCITTVGISRFKLDKLIEESAKNLKWDINSKDHVKFLCEGQMGSYKDVTQDEDIEKSSYYGYLTNNQSNGIFIPFAIDDMSDNILMANGECKKISEVNTGSIELYEDIIVGIVASLEDYTYNFDIAEFAASTGNIKINKDCGYLENSAVEFIKDACL